MDTDARSDGRALSRRSVLGLMGAAAGGAGLAVVASDPAVAAPVAPAAPEPPDGGSTAFGHVADAAKAEPKPAPTSKALRGDVRLYRANSEGQGLLAAYVDQWVLNAQQWVNATYGDKAGFVKAPENGRTGWPTMFALTRALQIELGLSGDQLSDNVGSTTMSLLTSKFGNIGPGKPPNVIKIVQSAQYCKGYDGDGISGAYGSTTKASVQSMRANMGFTDGRDTLSPKEFKALLTMDAYVVVENGSTTVRSVQQWMNRSFYDQSWFFIIPTDGHASRDVATALIYALQIQLGITAPTGYVGPATRAALKARSALAVGAADSGAATFVRLFQAGMIFNQYEVPFDGTFSKTVSDRVASFQQFAALPVTGAGDYQTWCSLLISTGDPERPGTAVDCVSTITPERAAALRAAGRAVVGRYLTNAAVGTLDKQIKPGELSTITAAGLRVFPIYQTYGGEASYFNPQQGAKDASLPVAAASGHGFKRGTVIYFAVDFDALNTDVTDNVIPHFLAIKSVMDYYGNPYRIGVYGARNVCSRLAGEGLTAYSFVSDLSTGFSGNLGFPLPRNWAFDQIATITIGTGAGAVEVDNDVCSGRDPGQAEVIARSGVEALDTAFDPGVRASLLSELEAYKSKVKSNTTLLNHSMSDALDVLVAYDELITNLSRSYGVRKALIQTPVFWEYWTQTPADQVADAAVTTWYAYQIAYEAWQKLPIGESPTPPIVVREDSSAGIAQIFAASAIRARNWALAQALTEGSTLDGGDWHTVYKVWTQLHDDGNYNISTVPLVLFEGGSHIGVTGQRLTFTDDEVRRLLGRYNGTGADADQYGSETFGVYQILESYNARQR